MVDQDLAPEDDAAVMLAAALAKLMNEQSLTQRDVAARLGYKSSVMLSHMALGRVPVPVEKIPDLTRVLDLDQSTFTRAVLRQRFPLVDWQAIFPAVAGNDDPFANDLAIIAARKLHALPADKKRVLREVVADEHPVRRWVSVDELPVLEAIRAHLGPRLKAGLSSADRAELISAISNA